MEQTRVVVLNEAKLQNDPEAWTLCFQYCRYEYGDGSEENGYRFIWRKPGGDLQGARGQARIPSVADIHKLLAIAMENGWGNHIN